MMLAVKLRDPSQASALVDQINREFPEVYAALGGDFADQLPDMQNSKSMTTSISILASITWWCRCLEYHAHGRHGADAERSVYCELWVGAGGECLGLILQESGYLGIGGGIVGYNCGIWYGWIDEHHTRFVRGFWPGLDVGKLFTDDRHRIGTGYTGWFLSRIASDPFTTNRSIAL